MKPMSDEEIRRKIQHHRNRISGLQRQLKVNQHRRRSIWRDDARRRAFEYLARHKYPAQPINSRPRDLMRHVMAVFAPMILDGKGTQKQLGRDIYNYLRDYK